MTHETKQILKVFAIVAPCILLLAVFVAISDSLLSRKTPASPALANKKAEPQWEWIHVTAEQLVADYRANEVAADEKYKYQHLAVSGTVGRITSEFMTLEVGDTIADVQCIYTAGKSGPTYLSRGSAATVYGVGQGKLHNVVLGNCGP